MSFRRTPRPTRGRVAKATARSLTYLGKSRRNPTSPLRSKLDVLPNPHPDIRYVVRFTAPEFTTLCPVTGQPDFAHLAIDYVPARWLVESKSFKLFLTSFR